MALHKKLKRNSSGQFWPALLSQSKQPMVFLQTTSCLGRWKTHKNISSQLRDHGAQHIVGLSSAQSSWHLILGASSASGWLQRLVCQAQQLYRAARGAEEKKTHGFRSGHLVFFKTNIFQHFRFGKEHAVAVMWSNLFNIHFRGRASMAKQVIFFSLSFWTSFSFCAG